MALVTASLTFSLKNSSPLLPSASLPSTSTSFFRIPTESLHYVLSTTRNRRWPHPSFAMKNEVIEAVDGAEEAEQVEEPKETLLYSFNPMALLFVAALPGGKITNSYLLSVI